jgi:hypothetical protein
VKPRECIFYVPSLFSTSFFLVVEISYLGVVLFL